ncbi:glycerate kinase [bacterium 210820-DFI.6.52]|nr:glycerate kinase [bacterium 210820-DFI.6.52]
MKRYLAVPDSFKGTLTSGQICDILADCVRRCDPSAQLRAIPVADGGEGTVDAFLAALGGEKIPLPVAGPYFEECTAFYGILEGSPRTAVIEMAACAGLPLVEGREDPLRTTTYGVGQLIADALARGCEKILLGLGGSCTNDGGAGAAAALGVRFLNDKGVPFTPVGGTLGRIAAVDCSGLDPRLAAAEKVAICDIDNPFYGPSGAAAVFAPQKGATPEQVIQLDGGLRRLAEVVLAETGRDLQLLPGAGAAGGMGGGVCALLGFRLQMGIDALLDAVHFDDLLRETDLVFTGEGRIDSQSLRGKVVVGVARRARAQGVPVIALVGEIGEGAEAAYAEGVSGIFSINPRAEAFAAARHRSADNLRQTADNLLHFCRSMGWQ